MFEHLPAELKTLVAALTILLVTILTAWVGERVLNRSPARYLFKRRVDEISVRVAQWLVNAGIYLVGISVALTRTPEFKTLRQSLLAGAGIITVVGGLASQRALSSIVSGFLIVFFRPFKIGDRVTVNNTWGGVIEDITLRETILRDFECNRVVVPNSIVSNRVLVNANQTDDSTRKLIDIGIGYDSGVDRAMAIMAEEITKHPLHSDNSTLERIAQEAPVAAVRVVSLGASSVNLRTWAWSADPTDGFVLQCDLLNSVKKRFDREGI